MFPLGILAGWFPLRISVIIVFIFIYTTIYFIIWSIESRRAQRDVNEINKNHFRESKTLILFQLINKVIQ